MLTYEMGSDSGLFLNVNGGNGGKASGNEGLTTSGGKGGPGLLMVTNL
jgi:hypothetical protein